MSHFRPLTLALLAATTTPLLAQQAPTPAIAPQQELPAEARGFRLSGPHLHPVERRTGGLTAGDFNGDGKLDFTAVSNDKSILELFLQDAKEESGFRKETVTLDSIIRDIAAIDVNGDGRTDLAVTIAGTRFEVMYQGAEGRIAPATETPLEADWVTVGDLNGDGRDDILTWKKGTFQILAGKARGVELQPAQTFHTVFDPDSEPLLFDIDGDGRTDIVYQDAAAKEWIVLRLQSPEGTFPTEFRVNAGLLRSIAAIPVAKGAGHLIAVQDKTRELVELSLSQSASDAKDTSIVQTAPLQTLAFDPDAKSDKIRATVADIDGDGRQDLVLATPEVPSLRVLRQDRSGSLRLGADASLEGIEQVAALPTKRGEAVPVLLASKKEKSAGIAIATKGATSLPFPTLQSVLGSPNAVTAFGGADGAVVAAVTQNASGAAELLLFPWKNGKLGAPKPAIAEKGTPPRTAWSDVVALAAVEANGDGMTDLVLFSEFKPAELLLQQKGGTFAPLAAREGIIEGLLNELKPAQLLEAKLDTRDKPVAIAVKQRFARAFTIGEDGAVAVAEQFNGRNTRSTLVAAATGKFRDPKRTDVVLLDTANKCLSFFGVKDGAKEYAELNHVDLDVATYRSLQVFDLDGDGRDDILLVAPDRVSVLLTRRMASGFETVATAKTPVEDGGYLKVWAVDILPGGTPEIVALEGRNQLLEFFVRGKSAEGRAALQRFYKFQVFETDSSLANRGNLDAQAEPRELLAVDFAEDGKPQLLGLTHDQVLRYPRRAADK